MKYLVTGLLALPLLSSCVVQEGYYEQDYYAPPQVEVHRYYPNNPRYNEYNQHYHSHNGYRPAPRGRIYHGHANAGGNAVIVNPGPPQAHVQVQQNVHGHAENNGNVHGHVGNSDTVVRRPPVAGAAGAVQGPGEIKSNMNAPVSNVSAGSRPEPAAPVVIQENAPRNDENGSNKVKPEQASSGQAESQEAVHAHS